ncbi:MAG: metal ABC transporter permease [Actinomycetota bacterium]|nr:metal ABC transporter permease [Actinomycetota bacterium]
MIATGLLATNLLEGEYLKALVGACIIGVVAPVVGTWIVLRRMANLGDTMSHGTLAGVGVAYAAGANVLFGALGAGVVIAVLLILFSASQRLGHEAIIAVMGSALFALGIIIISRIDTTEELEHILFGDVLQLTWGEIGINLVIGSLAIGVVLLLFNELRLASFDHVQAEQVGVHVELIQGVLVVLLALVVVISLRTVGSVMSVSMLVTPAATARLLSPTLRRMTIVGVTLDVAEGVAGVALGQALDAPPGATIGLLAAVVFAIAYAVTLPRRMPHHHRPIS